MKGASKAPRSVRLLLLVLVVLVVSFVWLLRVAYQAPAVGTEETLSSVYDMAAKAEIVEATLLDEDARIVGKRCAGRPTTTQPAEPPTTTQPAETPGQLRGAVSAIPGPCPTRVTDFYASYPRSDVITQLLIETIADSGAPVAVDNQTGKAVTKLLVTFVLPLLMVANVFGLIFLSRGGDSSISQIAGFGRIGRSRQRKRRSGTGVSFADVAGAEEAVAELREVIDYLTNPKRFEAYGAAAPKGVLLFGPPGCGKTLLARAVAGESGVPFFSISGAEFVESLVGVGAARVRDLFRQVRQVAPAIVFIDEIDAVGRRRSGEGGSGGEREQTVNQLLVEMDGFEVTAGIVLMGATNRPDMLDPALMRPGRFDRHVTLEPPDVHGRQAILELHARSRPVAPDVDFEVLARRTPGFTGADLANVLNEGALLALREGDAARITSAHLSEAVLRVLHGPSRRGRLMTAEERKRIAYHESGHALVAAALGRHSQVGRISVVARGRALGQSVLADDDERVLRTASEMHDQLAIALAGVTAEEVVFGQASTAGEDDIDKATAIASDMVGVFGMSQEVGRLRVLSRDDAYLGRDSAAAEVTMAPAMAELYSEVKRLVGDGERTASALLIAHRENLDRLAEALETAETMEGPTLEVHLAAVRPELNLLGSANGPSRARPRRAGRPSPKG